MNNNISLLSFCCLLRLPEQLMELEQQEIFHNKDDTLVSKLQNQIVKLIHILTINCKNSPSSVGGEMNCNKIKKNTCSGLGNVL